MIMENYFKKDEENNAELNWKSINLFSCLKLQPHPPSMKSNTDDV